MKGGETNAAKRIENRLELLKSVRQAGIWLVDASISALYQSRRQTGRCAAPKIFSYPQAGPADYSISFARDSAL
jgi:hypothetical protein